MTPSELAAELRKFGVSNPGYPVRVSDHLAEVMQRAADVLEPGGVRATEAQDAA